MNRYLSRIRLIGFFQIILSTGAALATDHEIVEIIRSKTEQITTTGSLEIQGAQIASVTVLPEIYELTHGSTMEMSLRVKLARQRGRDLLAEMVKDVEMDLDRKRIELDFLMVQLKQLGINL